MAQDFDVVGALQAGVSISQINDFLGKKAGFDTDAARKAGVSDDRILDHLTRPVAQEQSDVKNLDDQSDIGAGFKTAFKQIPQLGAGLIAGAGAVAESAFGEGGVATGIKEYGLQKYKESSDDIAQYQKDVYDFNVALEKAKGGDIGAMADWLQYGLGYGAGQVIQAAATGGVGSIAGKAALSTATKSILASSVEKQATKLAAAELGAGATAEAIAQKAGTEVVRNAAARNVASNIGAGLALGAQNVGMEGGEIFGDLTAKASAEGRVLDGDEIAKAFGATIGAAGVETAVDMLGLGALTGKIKIGGTGGLASRAAIGGTVGAAGEFGTEYLQTGIEQYGKGEDVFTDQAHRERIAAGALGAVGGGSIGSVGGALASPSKQREVGIGDVMNAQDLGSAVDAAVKAADLDLQTSLVPELASDIDAYNAASLRSPALNPSESLELAAAKGAMDRVGSLDLSQPAPIVAPASAVNEAGDSAARAVEAAGGVATPAQAAILDRAFPGQKMYDQVVGSSEQVPTVGNSQIITETGRAPRATLPSQSIENQGVFPQNQAPQDSQENQATTSASRTDAPVTQLPQAELIYSPTKMGDGYRLVGTQNVNGREMYVYADESVTPNNTQFNPNAVANQATTAANTVTGVPEMGMNVPEMGTTVPNTGTTDEEKILQNRDRATPSSIAQMASIAANPDYGRLSFSRDFANGAPVVAGGAIPGNQKGASDVAVASDGRRIPIRYAVVEANELLASNNADGTPNESYGTAGKEVARAIAGNGRIAGLQEAYNKATASGYRNELLADNLHGVDPKVISGMDRPVLVRIMPNDFVTADIGDVSNTVGNLDLSPVEQARNDVQRVNLEALSFADDGSVTANAVRQFVQAMPQAEQGSLLDTNGQPTKQAVDRLNAAIFAKAYDNTQLIRLYAQAQDAEARVVLSALAQSASKMARLEGAGALDIRQAVTDAAEIAVNARRNGLSITRAAQQIDITADPNVADILKLFARNVRSSKAIAESLGRAADFAYSESIKPEEGLFGPEPKASREDVFSKLGNDNEQSSEGNLEITRGGEPVSQDAIRRTDGRPGSADAQRPEASGPADDATAREQPANYDRTGNAEDFGLDSYTNRDIVERLDRIEKQQKEAADRIKAEEAKRQADLDRETFGLTGSESQVDRLEAQGQGRLFQPTARYKTNPDALAAIERAYGGKTAYNAERSAGKTELTYDQWLLVRTPAFREAFGDWEALRAQNKLDAMAPVEVRIPDAWRTLSHVELRQKMAEELRRMANERVSIPHKDIGDIFVGRPGIKKSISESRDPAKSLVAADIEAIIPQSIFARATPNLEAKDKNINGFFKLLANVSVDGEPLVAVFTVRIQNNGNWYYNSVVLHDAKEKARGTSKMGTGKRSSADSVTPTALGLPSFIRRPLDRVNPDSIQGDINPRTGEPANPDAVKIGVREYSSQYGRQLDFFLDYGPDQSQAGTAGETAQRAAVSAVDDLHATGTVLGKALSSDYATGQRTTLVGRRVDSAEDLATLAQVYRDPRFETFRLIFVNDAGRVVSQLGLTSRLPTSAQAIIGDDMDAYLADVSKVAKQQGATRFWMLHNHPSGTAAPSNADLQLTRTFSQRMPGLTNNGHVVIDTNEYGSINAFGDYTVEQKDFGTVTPMTAGEFTNFKITGPNDAMRLAKQIEVDVSAVTVLGLDAQLRVQRISTIPSDSFRADREANRALLLKEALATKTNRIIVVGRDRDVLLNAAKYAVDAIHIGADGGVTSLADGGAMVGIADLFPPIESRRTRLSPDSGKEFDYLRGAIKATNAMVARQSAWHGSPHRFTQFSLDHMGKGEGAQAYGWGLYFADLRDLAEWYRDNLSSRQGADPTQEKYAGKTIMEWYKHFESLASRAKNPAEYYDRMQMLEETELTWNAHRAVNTAREEKLSEAAVTWFEQTIASKFDRPGATYKVDIPEDSEMLLWDRPLSEQPTTVKAALPALLASIKKSFPQINEQEMTGSGLYTAYTEHRGGSKETASRALNDMGIKGIKYLDSGSRSVGAGTYNYVIFDDQTISVLAVYEEAAKYNAGQTSSGTKTSVLNNVSRQSVADAIAGHQFKQDIVNQAKYKLADIIAPGNGFNWFHKTVGTQFHKAKVNPLFKEVFDLGQQFLDDVTLFATRAEDKAADLFPRFGLSKSMLKTGLSKTDNQLIARALTDGTLENGPNPHDGVVWTDDQLRTKYGMNDTQIGYYRQARAALDQSLDDLAKSEMATHMRIAMKANITPLIRADISLGDVRDMLVQALDAGIASTTNAEAVKMLQKTKTQINGIYSTTTNLKNHGYAPLMRFGNFTVTAYDENGDVAFFQMTDTKSEASLMAKNLAGEFDRVETGKMSAEAHKLFKGITPDTLELFAKHAALPNDSLTQEYLQLAVSSRSAMKRLINRKGTTGYSLDATRTLATFLTSNARKSSSALNMYDMKQAADAIPREEGDVKDEAIKLVDYLQNPGEEAAKLRGFLFFQYLGGSIASGIVNLTQPILQTYPYLSQFGAGQAGSAMKTGTVAATHFLRGKRVGDPTLQAALEKAKAEGLIDPQEIYQLMAASQSGAGSFLSYKLMRLWGINFGVTEIMNRTVTFAAAFKVGQTLTQEQLQKAGAKDAYSFAQGAIYETQGIYNKGNRPDWARGAVGGTVFTFKQYSISYLEFMTRLYKNDKKAFGIALAILIMAAGLQGLPGADDLDDVIDTAGNWMGYATNSKKWKREFLEDILGKEMAAFALHGVSTIPGMPIDVQARLGLGNIIPGTGLLNPARKDKGREVAEVFGVAGGLAMSTMDTTEALARGDVRRAALSILPGAVRNLMQAGEMAATGEYRDPRGRLVQKVDGGDVIAKAIGFQPAEIAAGNRRMREVQADIDIVKTKQEEVNGKYARAIVDKDQGAMEEVRAEIRDWNQKNPDLRIKFNMSAIQQRVKQARLTKEARFIKSAPQQIRQQVREAVLAD